MRWRRCAVAGILACGCWHPIPWSPEGQRLADEREGRARAPEPAEPSSLDESAPPPEPSDAGVADGGVRRELLPGMVVMGYRPTTLSGVEIPPGDEWTVHAYSDHRLPIGAEASCPPRHRLALSVTDEHGDVTHGVHLAGIYVARKQDLGGHFTVRLKNLEPSPVICEVKIIALLVGDP